MKPIGNLAINYLGVKTEQFEVIERLPNKCYENGCTEARWLIQCKCGNKIEVPADNIRKRIENKITACRQCMQRSHQKYTDPSLVSAKQVIQFYKQSAKKRGLLYELSDEQFFYCAKVTVFIVVLNLSAHQTYIEGKTEKFKVGLA